MKKEKTWIVGTKTEAIKFAKQGLKLNDKTLKLKNVREYKSSVTIKHKHKTTFIPAVEIIADTDMQQNATMTVGFSKQHQNVFPSNFSESVPLKGKPSKGIRPLTKDQAKIQSDFIQAVWQNRKHLRTVLAKKRTPVLTKFQIDRLKESSLIGLINRMKTDRLAKKQFIIKDGIYAYHYPKNAFDNGGLCLVKANGNQKRPSVFSGTCIYDDSEFKQAGLFAQNWSTDFFKHIPSIQYKP